jgi:hypothetical protein
MFPWGKVLAGIIIAAVAAGAVACIAATSGICAGIGLAEAAAIGGAGTAACEEGGCEEAEDVLINLAEDGAASESGLLRDGAPISGTSGEPVDLSLESVERVAARAGVDLEGIKVSIVDDSELAGRGLYGHTPDVGNITLYPDAFANEETLATTLGHEVTHISQLATLGPALDTDVAQAYEGAAYQAEQTYLDHFRSGG